LNNLDTNSACDTMSGMTACYVNQISFLVSRFNSFSPSFLLSYCLSFLLLSLSLAFPCLIVFDKLHLCQDPTYGLASDKYCYPFSVYSDVCSGGILIYFILSPYLLFSKELRFIHFFFIIQVQFDK
jgi:hypothetical protein